MTPSPTSNLSRGAGIPIIVRKLRIFPQVCSWVGRDEIEAVAGCIESNWITEGPKTAEFSRRLNELMGVEYGIFAPNGTLSLNLGVLPLDIGPSDAVLVSDTIFIASANSVIMTGANPLFVEVNRHN